MKWFKRNGYGFINRNGTKEVVFVQKTAMRNNPGKYLHKVADGETVESDVVEGEKGVQAASKLALFLVLVEFQCKVVNRQQAVTIMDATHVTGGLLAITSSMTRMVGE